MDPSNTHAQPTRAWKFHFRSPLHVGERGVGLEETLEYIPSDSLFSALVVTWVEMGEHRHVQQLKASFATAPPPLLLTSAMPFVGDVLLWPKPQLPFLPASAGKGYKRVRWVSTDLFQRLTQGINQAGLEELWRLHGQHRFQHGTVWMMREEYHAVMHLLSQNDAGDELAWNADRVPKVTVDRIANASTLFHVGRLYFASECGLWCMAQGKVDWLQRMQQALSRLADSGIGGQRSRGSGQFRLEQIQEPHVFDDLPVADYGVLLSRLAPTSEQMGLLKMRYASYQLTTVGGFNGTPGERPLVRRQVRLLSEGSVIGRDNGVPGKLVNVNPFWDDENAKAVVPDGLDANNPQLPRIPYAVYRFGFGFVVPVLLQAEERPT